jgi:hypothetical protein
MEDIDQDFLELLNYAHINIINIIISNNIIPSNKIINTTKEWLNDNKNLFSVKFLLDLTRTIINFITDISILQSLFIALLKRSRHNILNISDGIKKEYVFAIRQVIDLGVYIPKDPTIISFLPDEIFFDYVSLNNDVIDKNLEIECSKYSSPTVLNFIQAELSSQNIKIEDPIILFVNALNSWNHTMRDYHIKNMTYDIISFTKILFVTIYYCNSDKLDTILDINQNNDFMLDAEFSLLLLLFSPLSTIKKI